SDMVVKSNIRAFPALKKFIVGLAITALVVLLIAILLYFAIRKLFFHAADEPLSTTYPGLLRTAAQSQRLSILIPTWESWHSFNARRTIDIRSVSTTAGWGETTSVKGLPGGGMLFLEHFDHAI